MQPLPRQRQRRSTEGCFHLWSAFADKFYMNDLFRMGPRGIPWGPPIGAERKRRGLGPGARGGNPLLIHDGTIPLMTIGAHNRSATYNMRIVN